MADVNVLPISKDTGAPTVGDTLDFMKVWCAHAGAAKALFDHVLDRLRIGRNEYQKLSNNNGDKDQLRHALVSLKGELVTFSNELQRYFGVRNLEGKATPRTNEMFAARVLGYMKLTRTLREIHAGPHGSSTGLERLFLLLKVEEQYGIEWREPFNADVAVFEKAVEESVENDAILDMYRQNAALAIEAVTLLRNAEERSDKFEWMRNAPAQALSTKLKDVKDYDKITLPVWFIPASDINYKSKTIATGSFSTVHYGTWGSNTSVVVKCLRAQTDQNKARDAQLRKMFLKEADRWFKISHVYTLKLFGACHVASPPFFVCEEAAQGDLKEVLRRDKSRMWRLLFQSALAIEYLHGKSIVHGDLKLNNILVTKEGYARVADFGLSRFKKPSRALVATEFDEDVEGSGALRWRAPEALDKKAQKESDVYSFGICIIEAISGEIPYHDVRDPNPEREEEMVRAKIKAGVLPQTLEEMEGMDAETWAVVLRMTEPNHHVRATIEEVIPFLKTKRTAEYDAEMARSPTKGLCPDCSAPLGGATVCERCKRDVTIVGRIKSKEDLPAVIELLTITDNQHNHKAATALSNYVRIGQEDWLHVFQAGAVPILAKMLTLYDLNESIRVDALKALGIVIVGSRKTHNSTQFEMANRQIQGAVEFEGVLKSLTNEAMIGTPFVKTNAIKVLGFWAKRDDVTRDTALMDLIRLAADPENENGQNEVKALFTAAVRALKFLGQPVPGE